jgi:hypothetical protein
VWVGGQLVLAGLVPVLRATDPALPKAAANAFNRIAWPAYWVLVATGIWNVAAEQAAAPTGWTTVLAVKVVLVALSGVSAILHHPGEDHDRSGGLGRAVGVRRPRRRLRRHPARRLTREPHRHGERGPAMTRSPSR